MHYGYLKTKTLLKEVLSRMSRVFYVSRCVSTSLGSEKFDSSGSDIPTIVQGVTSAPGWFLLPLLPPALLRSESLLKESEGC